MEEEAGVYYINYYDQQNSSLTRIFTLLLGSNSMSLNDDAEVLYEPVYDKLIDNFPELAVPYQEMLKWWGDDKPGPHIVYGELLNPLVDRLVEGNDDISLSRIFEFIERLSCSNDTRVKDLVVTTICEHIVSNPKILRRAQMLMGSSTRAQCQEVVNFRPSY